MLFLYAIMLRSLVCFKLQNDTNHIYVCNERTWCDKLYKWVMNKDSMFKLLRLFCVINRYVIVCLITIAKFYDVWNLNVWLLRSKHGVVEHKMQHRTISFLSFLLYDTSTLHLLTFSKYSLHCKFFRCVTLIIRYVYNTFNYLPYMLKSVH